MTNKMTIHRGLAELKLLDARILKAIGGLQPVGIYQKGRKINGNTEDKVFATAAASTLDSVKALIERKNAIKCAIVKTNAETKITINGKKMTIAEAINFKTLIDYQKKLIAAMQVNLKQAKANVEKNNAIVESNCQKILESSFGKDNVKVTKDDVESIRKPFIEQNEFHLFDPVNSEEVIKKLEEDVTAFETEVDATLSEINAVTMIEF